MTVHAYRTLDLLIPTYVEVSGNPPETAAPTWVSSTANAGPEWIFVHTAKPSWTNGPDYGRIKIIGHEYFHVLQHALGGPGLSGGPSDQIPHWLVEGAAEWVGWRAIADGALYDFGAAVDQLRSIARTTAVGLEATATTDGFTAVGNASYPLAFVAVDFLVSVAPLGIQSLPEFWRRIGEGAPWPAAFDVAFGRPIEGFYAEFAAYRSVVVPPFNAHIRGRVTRIGGAPFPSIFHVFACSTSPPGRCANAVTGTDGRYDVLVDSGTYVVSFSRTGHGAHPDGYYSENGFRDDFASATPIVVTGVGLDGIDVELPF